MRSISTEGISSLNPRWQTLRERHSLRRGASWPENNNVALFLGASALFLCMVNFCLFVCLCSLSQNWRNILFAVAFTFLNNVTLKAHYRQCFTTRIKREKCLVFLDLTNVFYVRRYLTISTHLGRPRTSSQISKVLSHTHK